MKTTFRPIHAWPGPQTPSGRRERARFKSSVSDTWTLLERELEMLRAKEVVIQLALDQGQILLDGSRPRANAYPEHPGVVVAFESRFGSLRYATDRFTHWQDNLRAIALSLEALRKVDRYGVSTDGEQYRGWNALGSGTPMGPTTMTFEDAVRTLHIAIGIDPQITKDRVQHAYKTLAKEHHPDATGSSETEMFTRIKAARDLLIKMLDEQ